MSQPGELRSGKGHRDENFPVASRLISPRHRAPILAFYEFVRVADDMADHPSLPAQEKLALLDRLEASLIGTDDEVPEGVRLRTVLRERSLSARHAQDLLTAFRMDVTKLRYRDWDDLMGYCSYSAMPVGRFVLDVHGEDRSTWPANDALCAALQIINHLQDCGKDFRDLDRVYVPLDALAATGASVEELGCERATPALRRCLNQLAIRTGVLLDESAPFSSRINDFRLAMEVAVIQALARRLTAMLSARDPLGERVHLT
jgi:squalene synthase HpnC